MWMKNQLVQRLVGRSGLMNISVDLTAAWQDLVLRGHKDPITLNVLRAARRGRRALCTPFESFLVHSIAKAQSKRPGDLAEVGVYEGATARLICEAKGDRTLHLFDTFQGLPKPADFESNIHHEGQFACGIDTVRRHLRDHPNVNLYQGVFPTTAGPIKDRTFSFVHFDVDLYEGTLRCLEFFYPRMIPAGIMLSHDYSILAGVKKAVHQFLADKPEEVIELPTTQCMIVKL